MTNEELISLGNASKSVLDAYFNNESKIDLDVKVFHALKRNSRTIEPSRKEYEALQKDGQDAFKKIENVDESKLNDEAYLKEVNAKLQAYRAIPENIAAEVDFLKEEPEVELFKVSVEDLDACILPVGLSEYFEKYIVR
jgi:hypothetical protein